MMRSQNIQQSSRHSLPGSNVRLGAEPADLWIPGTSPGMTGRKTQNLVGISLEGSVG
jgi:hypothetical protein